MILCLPYPTKCQVNTGIGMPQRARLRRGMLKGLDMRLRASRV